MIDKDCLSLYTTNEDRKCYKNLLKHLVQGFQEDGLTYLPLPAGAQAVLKQEG